MTAALSIQGLAHAYIQHRVLNGVDLELQPGDFLVGIAADIPVSFRGKRCRIILLPVQSRDIDVICLTGV